MIPSMIVLLTALSTVTPTCVIEDGYYWRNYKKKIPGDAVPGGLDSNGRPIYVGQALYKESLVPGKIYSNNSDIYFQYAGAHQADKNVKKLCSPFRKNFEWILINLNELTKLTNKMLVNGGFEPAYIVYVGRLYVGGETTVGKVVCLADTDACEFYYVLNGNAFQSLGLLEILVYNFDKD